MLRKVVIIDDEPWTRGVIMKLVHWNRLGLEAIGEAADGEAGLELIRRVSPDIVITDVRMPRINGIELVKTLRTEGFRIPILIISGYDDFSYVRSALQLDVTDYLLKPIKGTELNQQLERCVKELEQDSLHIYPTITTAGFFVDGWENIFSDIRQKLMIALHAGNYSSVDQSFDRLYAEVCHHEGEQPHIAIMIGIYYSLLLTLQQYIETIGVSRNEIFGSNTPSFVFGHDNTLQQTIDFIKELYTNTLRQSEKLHHQHSRIDIETVSKYLQDNYTRGVTLEQTADIFHVTKEYLSKTFKLHCGEGFSEYVTALRMKRAHELITEHQVPLKEVAYMVGYLDLAHFYKTFKKFFGKTPGDVREMLKNDNTISL